MSAVHAEPGLWGGKKKEVLAKTATGATPAIPKSTSREPKPGQPGRFPSFLCVLCALSLFLPRNSILIGIFAEYKTVKP